jgi:hypothetical protein
MAGQGNGMRKIAAFAGMVVTAAIAASSWPAAAQQAQTTLPELSVTAPKNQRPPEWYAPRVGILGHVRVEEDKWPEIPCASAHIDAASSGTCQDGPKVIATQAYIGGSANVPFAYGSCTIYHPLITTTIGRFDVEADVLVFDPYRQTGDRYNGSCTIWSGFKNLPDDFRDMNRVARQGTDWHDFVGGNGQPGAQSTIAFSQAGRACLAVERLGPYWHAGFIWVLHATMCETDGVPAITPVDVDGVVAALQIRVHDASGTLPASSR